MDENRVTGAAKDSRRENRRKVSAVLPEMPRRSSRDKRSKSQGRPKTFTARQRIPRQASRMSCVGPSKSSLITRSRLRLLSRATRQNA